MYQTQDTGHTTTQEKHIIEWNLTEEKQSVERNIMPWKQSSEHL